MERSSVDERGMIDDPARCGAPNANPELFSDQWGKGTVIATKFGSTYEDKRMSKIISSKHWIIKIDHCFTHTRISTKDIM